MNLALTLALWAAAAQPINDGCHGEQSSLLVCQLQPGTHVYSIRSGEQMVYLANYGGPVAVTRVRTATFARPGFMPEISVYLDWFGLCDAPKDYCVGNGLEGDKCPCQRDSDGGPKLNLVGAVGNMPANADGFIPDLTWGVEGFTVDPFRAIAIGDNPHGTPVTLLEVTVENRRGADLVMRQPKIDNVIPCSGSQQWSKFEPWQADTDMTITGAQVYAVGGAQARRVTWACVYVFATNDPTKPPLWSLCSHPLATNDTTERGNVAFTKDVKAGQWIDAGAVNACPKGEWWDYVASLTVKRK